MSLTADKYNFCTYFLLLTKKSHRTVARQGILSFFLNLFRFGTYLCVSSKGEGDGEGRRRIKSENVC